jgi:hypothetical protein
VNKQKKKKHRDKKRDKDKELQASLMVACLKRLLPVGLNLFAGREQELVQHCKDRFLRVITIFLTVGYHLKEIGFEEVDWIPLAQDRIQWWFLVNIVMTFWFHQRWRVYLLTQFHRVSGILSILQNIM